MESTDLSKALDDAIAKLAEASKPLGRAIGSFMGEPVTARDVGYDAISRTYRIRTRSHGTVEVDGDALASMDPEWAPWADPLARPREPRIDYGERLRLAEVSLTPDGVPIVSARDVRRWPALTSAQLVGKAALMMRRCLGADIRLADMRCGRGRLGETDATVKARVRGREVEARVRLALRAFDRTPCDADERAGLTRLRGLSEDDYVALRIAYCVLRVLRKGAEGGTDGLLEAISVRY